MVRFGLLAILLTGIVAFSAFGQENGQLYRIKNRLTDKFLIPDEKGTHLVQGTVKGKEKAGQWKLVKAKEGNFFMIVHAGSGRALTSPSKTALDQIALEEPGKGGSPKAGQLWGFEKRDKMFTIESRYSGLYLDVFNFEKEDGVKIIQQKLNEKGGRGNQIWELIRVKTK